MEDVFVKLIGISNKIIALKLDSFEDLAQLEVLQDQQAELMEQVVQAEHSTPEVEAYVEELKKLEAQINEKLRLNRQDSENQIKKMQNAMKLRGRYQSNQAIQAEGYFVDNQN